MSTRYKPNKWQRAVAKAYACGDMYYYVRSGRFATYRDFVDALNTCGDSEFKLYMIELASNEDCSNVGVAEQRLRTISDNAAAMADVVGGVK